MAQGRKTGGRQKGTPNKATTAVKEALSAAYEGLGGTAHLIKWAKAEPGEFYKLWAKMLPTEVKAEVDATIHTVERRIVDPNHSNG